MGEVEGVRSHKKVDSPKLSPQKKLTDSHFACKFRSILRAEIVSIFGSKFLMYTAFLGGCSRIHRKLRDGKGSIPLYILTYTYYYVCMCIYIYMCVCDYMRIYMYIIYIYIYIHICTCTCTCICIYEHVRE